MVNNQYDRIYSIVKRNLDEVLGTLTMSAGRVVTRAGRAVVKTSTKAASTVAKAKPKPRVGPKHVAPSTEAPATTAAGDEERPGFWARDRARAGRVWGRRRDRPRNVTNVRNIHNTAPQPSPHFGNAGDEENKAKL